MKQLPSQLVQDPIRSIVILEVPFIFDDDPQSQITDIIENTISHLRNAF